MKCFVASAFEKPDVDEVYDLCVEPALKTLSVKALRVDRVEHNEDIDKKIFELLDEADLAIVDLTYARPSVYYEAGYAVGRGKPVIYIAKNDHFRARDNDPDGCLRVHFDLQMKNIIPWSKANEAFSNRLDKRLRQVLKPLLAKRDKEQKRQEERSRFARLSQHDQINLLKTKAGSLLEATGFSLQKAEQLGESPPRGVLASRKSSACQQEVEVICTPSALNEVFDRFQFQSHWRLMVINGLLPPEQFHYIVVSLKSVPRARVTGALCSYSSSEDGTLHWRYKSESRNSVPVTDVFVHVIDGVKSESEFEDALRSIINRLETMKNGMSG